MAPFFLGLMTTVTFPVGTLLWTPDGPRPIETLQAGEMLIGFNPETFSRVPVTLQRVQIQEQIPVRRLLVGGRMLTVAETQSCSRFDLNGDWRNCSAADIREGDFLPVDRRIPVPVTPIALPRLDDNLTHRLDEDPLALSDALYNSAPYFREMEKRELRLALYELLGALCEVADLENGNLECAVRDGEMLAYYDDLCRRIFGTTMTDPAIVPRLELWLGDGLSVPPDRALPAWVWQLPNPAISAFLRGFFDNAATVTETEISVWHESLTLMTGVQALLGRLHIESILADVTPGFGSLFQLTVRNVRRFAEWVNSVVAEHAGILKAVYTREPRYPSESTAHLPLNVIRPALERIRNRYALPPRTTDTVDEAEATRLETLRLLATAFHDSELRDAVNQQLYLEPVTATVTARLDTLFILSLMSPATVIANGVVIGGTEIRVKSEE